ncbi:hypothetical protein LTR10_008448 [Elasticomyces elasticus]|nr:hypothetical protein LTR10_008448 [Elasticomyces elasticus]KAK4967320.1 hypothetical protein LTR42_010669 [Elasticomyces elasticus]
MLTAATLVASILALHLPSPVIAQSVFAHVLVGNTAGYGVAQWTSDIKLAAKYHIDGFVLNIATPYDGTTSTQLSLAFQAIDALPASVSFKLLLSFDYLGGAGAWVDADVINIMKTYGPNGAYFHVDGKPMVSTFEGPSNSNIQDWLYINGSIPGGIYLVPDWTSLGSEGFSTDLVDGACECTREVNGSGDTNRSQFRGTCGLMARRMYRPLLILLGSIGLGQLERAT